MKKEVLILGWYGPDQKRLTFVSLLCSQLGSSRAEALALLNRSLDPDEVPIRLDPKSSVSAFASELATCGCEVRVSPNPDISDQIRSELQSALSDEDSLLAARVAAIAPDLRPTSDSDSE